VSFSIKLYFTDLDNLLH